MASSSNPLTIKPEQRLKEHPDEPFSISNRKLFCQGCCEEICVKSSSVKNHIKSNKHQEGKKHLQRKEARETLLTHFVVLTVRYIQEVRLSMKQVRYLE